MFAFWIILMHFVTENRWDVQVCSWTCGNRGPGLSHPKPDATGLAADALSCCWSLLTMLTWHHRMSWPFIWYTWIMILRYYIKTWRYVSDCIIEVWCRRLLKFQGPWSASETIATSLSFSCQCLKQDTETKTTRPQGKGAMSMPWLRTRFMGRGGSFNQVIQLIKPTVKFAEKHPWYA